MGSQPVGWNGREFLCSHSLLCPLELSLTSRPPLGLCTRLPPCLSSLSPPPTHPLTHPHFPESLLPWWIFLSWDWRQFNNHFVCKARQASPKWKPGPLANLPAIGEEEKERYAAFRSVIALLNSPPPLRTGGGERTLSPTFSGTELLKQEDWCPRG